MIQHHHVKLKLPPGVTAEPAFLEGTIGATSRQQYQVRLTMKESTQHKAMQIVAFDISLDGKRYGELFNFVIRFHK